MSGLFVTSLALSHFRSHRRLRLAFDGRPVAIHGPNGVGKTNLLEAVSLLSPGRGLRRAPVEEIARRPEAVGWKVSAGLAGPHAGHEIDLSAEPGLARATKIDGKAAAQTRLAGVLRILWLVPSQDRLWIGGAEGRRRFLDRMTLSFAPDHAARVLTYEKAMRERNRLLKDQARNDRWYAALEAQMAEAGARIVENRTAAVSRLARAQASAATAFPVADLTVEDDSPPGAAELAAALAAGRAGDLAAGRTSIGPHRADLGARYRDKGVSARQCSTGEQKALLLSLVLANARALKADTGGAPLILLDEVAAHLDGARRAALFDEICALGGQAWMTGTGPDVFAELGARAQHVAVSESGGESRAVPVSAP